MERAFLDLLKHDTNDTVLPSAYGCMAAFPLLYNSAVAEKV